MLSTKKVSHQEVWTITDEKPDINVTDMLQKIRIDNTVIESQILFNKHLDTLLSMSNTVTQFCHT